MSTILFHNKKSTALTPQKKIDMFNYPFTLNTTIGCLYACKYCYLQNKIFSKDLEFGKEMKVKTWLPEQLDKELNKFQDLPQHLKRVQINNAAEGYHPLAVSETQEQLSRDIMSEIYNVFEQHWNNGDKWMLHVVTKSNLILNHLELLKRMKHMVQVELTLITADQDICNEYERFTPSVSKRLEMIRLLSDAGILVRVMASPFVAQVGQSPDDIKNELTKLKDITFYNGARAFKNKGLNYFSDIDVRNGKPKRMKGQNNYEIPELMIKSGEPIKQNEFATVLMPSPNHKSWAVIDWKNRVEEKEIQIVDFGYSEMNNGVDWKYII